MQHHSRSIRLSCEVMTVKKWLFLSLIAAALAVSGCSQMINPIKGNAIIDWVDFVKLNGNLYRGLYHHVIKDPNLVTDQVVGEVKFRVADVVSNPKYKTKDGDAAFLAEGTKLYQVEGFRPDELIAAKDENRIGGYRLYAGEEFYKTVRHHYKDMPKNQVEQIQLFVQGEVQAFRSLTGEEISRFLAFLENGEDKLDFSPDQTNGDPKFYNMVFYADGPLAYVYDLADDGKNVFFNPWYTRVVDDEIRKFLEPQQ